MRSSAAKSGFRLVVCCLTAGGLTSGDLLRAADVTASPAAAGTISSTAAIMIDGTMMAKGAAPSWPLVDRDEIGTTSAAALIRTAEQNAVTLQPESRARLRSPQPGQLFVYLRAGSLNFETKASGVSICAGDRLYLPVTPGKGSVGLSLTGRVTASGMFTEAGIRACSEDGVAGVLTAVPGAVPAGGAAAGGTAAGGTAIGAAAGGTAAGAAAGGVAAAAAGAVGVGAAAAAGIATTTGSSGCTSAAGCNFNATSVSSSTP